MPLTTLPRKVRSARYHLERAFERWMQARVSRTKRRCFDAWLAQLRSNPPDVLMGSNFAAYGGMRAHMHAIRKYSSLRVGIAPSDAALSVLDPHDFKTWLRDAFLDFDGLGIRVAHSHVFPWFIEWCRRHRRPDMLWVHTYHAPYFPEYTRGELLPWQEEINDYLINHARYADVRISVALWQQAWLSETHGIESVYLPNGVDVEVCDEGRASRFTDRTGRENFVLFVGRNDPVKNPAEFVRLAQRMPGQEFVMMGGGLSAGALLDEWDAVVPPNLLVQGDTAQSEVQDALAACSALVLTSRREGLPTVVLEAMAHSKPVVVPNDAGCTEAIGGGECGFIYAQNDIDDLVRQTEAALADSTVSARGRARVLAEYDWRVIAPKLDRIYRGEAA